MNIKKTQKTEVVTMTKFWLTEFHGCVVNK